jgi:hypothetical protein
MLKRRRDKQLLSFQDRLAAFANDARERASFMPLGLERNEMIKKAKQADDARHLDDWARSLFAELGSR